MAQHPLKSYREDRNLSLEALGDKIQVDKSTVLRWERGTVRIPPARLGVIEKITGIPREKLRPDIFGRSQAKGAA